MRYYEWVLVLQYAEKVINTLFVEIRTCSELTVS